MNLKGRIIQFLVALSFLLAAVLVALAATGRLSGKVVDKATGQIIAGTKITILETGQEITTDATGRFEIDKIDAGIYTLRVSAPGYQGLQISRVEVMSNSATEIKIGLNKKTGRKEEHIRVTSSDEDIELVIQAKAPAEPRNKIGLSAPVISKCLEMADGGSAFPPAHGGTAIVNGRAYDAMFFKDYGTNPFVDTEDDHLSTFAIDVDDASFIMARSYLERGYLPPDQAVRTEEFINHFDYEYDSPRQAAFSVSIDGAPSRFGSNCLLMRIGIKGRDIMPENRKPANLVFVIDVSGSMAREDRLTLVKRALRLLVEKLEPKDKVGLVVYGSQGRVILEPTSISRRQKILAAIERLQPGGSTNAEEGLRLGYDMAEKHFIEGHINRIILCSDGVANVGTTGAEDLLKWIRNYAERGITLTAVGFGMGNYNDILMEKLGNKGNGHYAYVDDIAEARRVFIENLTGTLQVIARDVKIQVAFDTGTVRSYRLLGYENRDVDDDKFRDDKEDGGEIGSGHQVTALYEIKLHRSGSQAFLGTVFVRYKDPDENEVDEVNYPITTTSFADRFADASAHFKLAAAAAEFSEILGKSYWAKESKLAEVQSLLREVFEEIDSAGVIEFMDLLNKAEALEDQLAEK